jgi:hypothetical protein
MLMPATGLRAAEPGGMLPFAGELHSSTKVFPARLAAFAECADRPRIFGKVEGRRYRIDLPAGTRCMVFVGEHEWESPAACRRGCQRDRCAAAAGVSAAGATA